MKNKKIIIGVILVIIVSIICVIGYIKKDSISSIITLDINPSIELEIKSNKVIRAEAINEDANDYVEGLKGKSLDESLNYIIKKAKDNNLDENGNITIILGMENNNKKIEDSLKEACNKNSLNANIIVPKITEEAKNEAQAQGLTAAKAAYIMDVIKENDNVSFKDLINKPGEELDEMKQTGRYCDSGYTLVGEFCEKAIKEEKPEQSKVCPEGYEEINNKCYLKADTIQTPYCKNDLELKNNKCVGIEKNPATGKCATGTYNSKTAKCEILTYVSDGKKTCREENDLLLDNGRCASAHPGAHSYGEPGTVDPATECCCGDTYKNGWCYSLPNGNYDASITCASGSTLTTGDKGKACYKTETSEATYSCSKGTLDGDKCIINVSKNPEYKNSCNSNLELYKDKVCINYSNTKEYIIGNKCKDDAKLINGKCVYYSVVDAKTK